MKIFLTGATGFLGFHIANICISNGAEILCLKRTSSRSKFDSQIEKKIKWVNRDTANWKEVVKDFAPDTLIHSAWEGVSSKERNDEEVQKRNIEFTQELITLTSYKQIIILGSQDEYGIINHIVTESDPLIPVTEYAKAKIQCCQFLKEYAERHNIVWQWIRVFSIYGEQQNNNWLIPSIIQRCLSEQKEIETTKGEQTYSYLYSADFAKAIYLILSKKQACSGIYNLSSKYPIKLKDLFELIKQSTHSKTNFIPCLPYRENQSMTILGNCQKFINTFGEFEQTTLQTGINNLIEFYTHKNESI